MLLGLAALLSSVARAEEPIKTVSETVVVPAGLDPAAALASIDNVPRIFELYEPAIPWVPGVTIGLSKEVVSARSPAILELPVSGNVGGKPITERARVTASTEPTTCGEAEGRKIVLDFESSSYNIERRINRIEIVACIEPSVDGTNRITATGRMYEGFRPLDPRFNGMLESIGARAIQTAFIRQVAPIVEAVQLHWLELPHS